MVSPSITEAVPPAWPRRRQYAGVEIEDIIYLIGPITWAGGLEYFFLAYGFGSFGYLAWTLWEALKPRR